MRPPSTPLSTLKLIELHDEAASNTASSEEIETLEAIYQGAISCRRLTVFGTVALVADVSMEGPSLRVLVYNYHMYLRDASPSIYCWIAFPKIPAPILREIAQAACKEANSLLAERSAPVLFDLIQSVQTSLLDRASVVDAAPPLPDPPPTATATAALPPRQDEAGTKSKPNPAQNKAGGGGGKGKGKGKAAVEDVAPATPPASVPDELSKPLTRHTEQPEYRTAFSEALNAGLSGQSAHDHAISKVEHLLPSSVFEELKREVALLEKIKNRAVNLETLSVKGEIDSIKHVVAQTDCPKTRARALLLETKRRMVDEGRHYGRDEKSLLAAWIAETVETYRTQVKAKEEKQKQQQERGQGGRRRGPTIRDAYEAREAAGVLLTEGVAGQDDEEQDEEADAEAEAGGDEEEEIQQQPSTSALMTQSVDSIRQRGRQQSSSSLSTLGSETPQQRARKELDSRRLKEALDAKRTNSKYQELISTRSNLPAFQMRDHIVSTINANQVVVVSGDTGCGKTTQVPQLVLDALIDALQGADASMVVTQPRRISAISVAERIAQERCERIGETAGYHIRLEAKKSAKTKILMMTTGVLLRKLQIEGELHGVSHVFVDEVHERDINTDFLLIVLKDLLRRRPTLKIILMSATLNAELFSKYFSEFTSTLISIPGRAFPVTTFFLEDALEQTGHRILPSSDCVFKVPRGAPNSAELLKERQKRWTVLQQTLGGGGGGKSAASKKCSIETLKSLEIVDEAIINKELVRALVEHIHLTCEAGAILIFVPGLADIRDIITLLKESRQLDPHTVKLHPLHSSLSSAEQNRVFDVPKDPRVRKIVVTTNIAETSITVPDAVYVIDTVRVKQTAFDAATQISSLEEAWVSQASARQRRGRAGRVRPGVCYHLATSHTFHALPGHTTPEMLRLSLEELILQILALDLGDPFEFLGSAISPPSSEAIGQAIMFLDDLDAVYLEHRAEAEEGAAGTYLASPPTASAASPEDELSDAQITPLGFHLASLPISPRIGKLLLYSVLFECVDPILTIAATVSAKSPFLSPFESRDAADEAKQRFAQDDSDLLAQLSAYLEWKAIGQSYAPGDRDRRRDRDREREEDDFCNRNFLSLHSLQLIDQMRAQFLDLLIDIGFLPACTVDSLATQKENRLGTDVNILRCVLTAGLAPNILRIPSSGGSSGGTCALPKKLSEVCLDSRRGGVFIHPSSVKSSHKTASSSYFVYLEAIKTAKVYARDVTSVPALTCILFGGRLKLFEALGAITVDSWIGFRATPVLMRALSKIRGHMEAAFEDKVVDPSAPTSDKWRTCLKMIVILVSGLPRAPVPVSMPTPVPAPVNGGGRGQGQGQGRGRGGGGGRGHHKV